MKTVCNKLENCEVEVKVTKDENIKIGKSEITILETFTDFKEDEKITK